MAAYSAPALLPRTPGQLAWAHCWLTFRYGFWLLPVVLVLAVVGTLAWVSWGRVPADYYWAGLARLSPWYLLAALLPALVLLGVPALGGALLRVPVMRAVFVLCCRPGVGQPLALALLGTALAFGAVVLLAAALPQAVANSTRFDYWRTAGFVALCSLPWLLGALAATWRLRGELAPAV